MSKYFDRADPAHSYGITARQVLLTKNGISQNLTNVCGADGHVYALYNVDSTPYRIQVWGDISDTVGNNPPAKFYWDATYSYAGASTNSCWQGAGSQTRPALHQEEAWWSYVVGGTPTWDANASGSISASTQEPDGNLVNRNSVMEIGLGAGYLWNYYKKDKSSGPFCLVSTQAW